MNGLFSSFRQSLGNLLRPGQESVPDLTHPAVVKSNPAYLLLGQTDLNWSAHHRKDVASSTNLPESNCPYVFRAQRGGVTVHTGTINRGQRDIAYFHLTRDNGATTVTYVPKELLLQLQDDVAKTIPAIRSLMDAAA
jgi:hypothetical protein